MIDHVSLQVTDLAVSRRFYEVVLAPLGLRAAYTDGDAIGFADGSHAPLWLLPAERRGDRELHVAFAAPDHQAVHAYHQAAVGIGAAILHPPRLFPEYHADYFACFVRDPDGHNIEAVCRQPQT